MTPDALPVWEDAFFRLAVEAAPNGQLVVDSNGIIVLANAQIDTIFGYERSELIGRCVDDLIPERLREQHPALRATYLQNPTVRAMGVGRDLFGRRQDGSEVPIEVGLNPLPIDGRRAILVSIVDISERLRAEQRWRALLEASPNGLLLVDRTGAIELVNRQIETIFGYDRQELIGQPIEILVPEHYRSHHPEKFATFFADPQTRAMGAGRDLYGRHRDGSEVPVEIGLNPIEVDGLIHVLASVVDISARRQLEAETHRLHQQIQHAQRLESLGVLAGGIAHDFNNILAGIVGHADLAALETSEYSAARIHIDKIQTASIRASDLTRQMLAYAGRGSLSTGAIDLNTLIRDMTSLLEVSIPKKTCLRLDLADRLPEIEGDTAQLQQVIMNLITNASEAIGDGSGMISIHSSLVKADADYLQHFDTVEALLPGYYVSIEVADTGCGMDETTRTRLFEPFFTTKITGRGLGMAALLGIVRSHGGGIRVYTEPGRGSKFKILLPVQADENCSHTQKLQAQNSLNSSGQRALIIDDEEHVRSVLAMMLAKCGYESLLATDGRDGLMLYEANHHDIAVIFLDMNMPVMGGEEVLDELHRRKTTADIVMMSGYNQPEATIGIAGKPITAFLQKPFSFAQLVAMLQQAQADR